MRGYGDAAAPCRATRAAAAARKEAHAAVSDDDRTKYSGEHDESWTRLDEIEARDRRRAESKAFVSTRLLEP